MPRPQPVIGDFGSSTPLFVADSSSTTSKNAFEHYFDPVTLVNALNPVDLPPDPTLRP
jgi:hypothetical protein